MLSAAPEPSPARRAWLLQGLARLGLAVEQGGQQLLLLSGFVGQVQLALLSVLLRPSYNFV